MTKYAELRLRIDRGVGRGSYRITATGPAGEALGRFKLPFSDMELENFILKVGATRRGRRRIDSPEMELAKNFGTKLFGALFEGDVRELFRSSFSETRAAGQGLRVTLSLTGAPELLQVPWEYMYDHPSFLSISTWTPIVRYLDLPKPRRPLQVALPIRILAMVSSPSDAEVIDAKQERAKLEAALGPLIEMGAIAIDWLEEASLRALQRQLRRGDYHVFHFIGHGGYDQDADDGVLLFEDEVGRGRRVSGIQLGTILADEVSLRLAVLNSCEGARSSLQDPFSGVATSLIEREIPAVIGMQFEITDRAAIVFAGEFYSALADGLPVDSSVAEARKAIYADQNDIEWGTPVLFMRVADGRLFDVQSHAPIRAPEMDLPTAAAAKAMAAAAPTEPATDAAPSGEPDDAEKVRLARAEAEAVQRERAAAAALAAAEQLEKERREEERLAHEAADAAERQRAEADAVQREREAAAALVAAEQLEKERREEERLAHEAADAAERQRAAAEAQRLEAERVEQERISREAAEAAEREREAAEAQQLEVERVEQERISREAAEAAEREREAAEAQQLEVERVEQERISREAAERDRAAAEAQRLEAERVEQERISREAAERDRAAAEAQRLEAERVEQERISREAAERDRAAAEQETAAARAAGIAAAARPPSAAVESPSAAAQSAATLPVTVPDAGVSEAAAPSTVRAEAATGSSRGAGDVSPAQEAVSEGQFSLVRAAARAAFGSVVGLAMIWVWVGITTSKFEGASPDEIMDPFLNEAALMILTMTAAVVLVEGRWPVTRVPGGRIYRSVGGNRWAATAIEGLVAGGSVAWLTTVAFFLQSRNDDRFVSEGYLLAHAVFMGLGFVIAEAVIPAFRPAGAALGGGVSVASTPSAVEGKGAVGPSPATGDTSTPRQVESEGHFSLLRAGARAAIGGLVGLAMIWVFKDRVSGLFEGEEAERIIGDFLNEAALTILAITAAVALVEGNWPAFRVPGGRMYRSVGHNRWAATAIEGLVAGGAVGWLTTVALWLTRNDQKNLTLGSVLLHAVFTGLGFVIAEAVIHAFRARPSAAERERMAVEAAAAVHQLEAERVDQERLAREATQATAVASAAARASEPSPTVAQAAPTVAQPAATLGTETPFAGTEAAPTPAPEGMRPASPSSSVLDEGATAKPAVPERHFSLVSAGARAALGSLIGVAMGWVFARITIERLFIGAPPDELVGNFVAEAVLTIVTVTAAVVVAEGIFPALRIPAGTVYRAVGGNRWLAVAIEGLIVGGSVGWLTSAAFWRWRYGWDLLNLENLLPDAAFIALGFVTAEVVLRAFRRQPRAA